MPQQNSPPYYPASITIPRLLVRWDDVNAQNGPLRRARLFLPFPSFGTITPNWNGTQDIVAAFNFECQNNFTIPVIVPSVSTVFDFLVTVTVAQATVDNRSVIGVGGGSILGNQP